MTDIPYTLVRSRRKTLAIQITTTGEVLLRCPNRLSKREAEQFLEAKRDWVEAHRQPLSSRTLPPLSPEEMEALRSQALTDLASRVQKLAPAVGVSYGRLTVRTQRTRWGSCSTKGNLNFNALLLLCPEEVRDYVVVHELCHRLEMNHSPAFWAQVARVCPEYPAHRKWLRENGTALLSRLPN